MANSREGCSLVTQYISLEFSDLLSLNLLNSGTEIFVITLKRSDLPLLVLETIEYWMETNEDVCTLEEFISSMCNHIVVQIWNETELNVHGNYTGIYTSVWIDWRTHEITLRCHWINCSWIRWELILAGLRDLSAWESQLRVLSAFHTLQLVTVSNGFPLTLLFTGKLLIALDTVNCLKHVSLSQIAGACK